MVMLYFFIYSIKIVDDDIDIKDLKRGDDDDEEMAYAPREEKPSIAAIIDERPNHLIRQDLDRNRWRTLQSSCPTDPDCDASPPPPRRRLSGDDSDLSPPRSSSRAEKATDSKRNDSDDDLSPPRPTPQSRRSHSRHDREPDRRRRSDESQRKTSARTDGRSETLAGKVAGLSDAKSVREEMKRLQEREAQVMQRLGDETLGRNSKTVYRDRGTGRVRDLEAEAAVSVKTDKEGEERAARYKDWSQGLRQREERNERLQQDLKEMDKPLARYEDDEDRDKFLKEKELDDDPMLQFVRRKKLKEKVRDAAGRGEVVFAKPAYRGPPPPPNRFAILPGYRWDGVDRSNGYEKKLIDKQAERMAVQEEAYKWSTEDM